MRIDLNEFGKRMEKIKKECGEAEKKLQESIDKSMKNIDEAVHSFIEKNKEDCEEYGMKIIAHPGALESITHTMLVDIMATRIMEKYDIEVEAFCTDMVPNNQRIVIITNKPYYAHGWNCNDVTSIQHGSYYREKPTAYGSGSIDIIVGN